MVPCVVGFFFLTALTRVLYLRTLESVNPWWSPLFRYKQLIALLFLLLELFMFIYAFASDRYGYEAISAGSLLFGQFLVLAMQTYEHNKGNRTPNIISLYWLLLLLVEVVRLRTYILRFNHDIGQDYEFVSFLVELVFVIASLFLSCFAEPDPNIYRTDINPSPELSANLFSTILFSWISPMIAKGYRKPLTEADLWTLNPEDQSMFCNDAFSREWKRESRKKTPSLTKAFFRSFGFSFVIGGLYKLVQDILGFVPPFLLNYVISFLQNPDAPGWQGYMYAVAMLVSATVQSIFLHQYFQRITMTGLQLRSATITSVFDKALRLSNSARQGTTVGAIVNLMTVDAQRFNDLMMYIHMIWSAPLQISIAIYFLWTVVGASAFAGLGVMILMIPLNAVMAKKTRALQVLQMKQKDSRIKEMNEILNGIKVIKLYAWERPFQTIITKVAHHLLASFPLTSIP